LAPWDDCVALAEKRVRYWLGEVACSVIVEQEADADIIRRRERGIRDRRIGDEFPSQRASVIRYAVEVWVDLRQVGEAEIGEHSGVGAELNIKLILAFAGDGAVESGEDLRGDD